MLILSNPLFDLNAPCLEQEYIRWDSVVQVSLLVYEAKEAHKASYVRGWIGDQGTKYLINMNGKKVSGKITNL